MEVFNRLCEGVQLSAALDHMRHNLTGQPDHVVQQKLMAARKTILYMLAEVIVSHVNKHLL